MRIHQILESVSAFATKTPDRLDSVLIYAPESDKSSYKARVIILSENLELVHDIQIYRDNSAEVKTVPVSENAKPIIIQGMVSEILETFLR